MAGKILLQQALQKPYERRVFITEILQPVFQNKLQIPTSPIDETPNLSQTETSLIKQVLRYGSIALDDDTDIICYEITLHDAVRLEQNRISIQQYVRKLMVAGDVMLLNFVQQKSPASWRLSLVASDTKVSHTGEIKATKTNAKRYTYLLGQAETCLTAASQLAILESKSNIERKDLIEAFAVEKVSKPFFDEYTKIHYKRFNDYLMASNFKAAVFNGDEKAMRDFVKKLLGRIVFLYFVQKKGWLGSKPDFMMHLFKTSGGNETFYPLWLSELFFNALNAPRPNDAFVMPDKTVVSIPFLNGGLFEKDKHDEHFLTFPPQFFHNTDNFESDKERGFLDFLNAYNFTVYEDSPDDHTVAVDPEMLGHIFENLLEDNKDKGAFYTPKEIVHYMCQESLIEYCLNYDFSDSGITMIKEEKRAFISHFIKKNEIDVDLLKKSSKSYESYKSWFRQLNAALETVRICDPAIGSGAFPMGLLHEIFNAKILLHQAIEGVPPTPKQRVEMKLHIIQNSIYGVDIERGAVDIARLRFWLSLIVDEQTPKALPNLDYKIVVGNSLVSKFEDEVISIDWDKKVSAGKANDFVQHIQRLLKEVADKQKQYFDAEVSKKQALTSKIRALKLELLINQFSFNKDKYMNTTPQLGAMFPTAREIKANTERLLTIANFDKQIKKLQTLKQHPEKPFLHFDWKLDFPEVLNPHLVAENGGFDIVIGNPPYGAELKYDKIILKKLFPETSFGNIDSYKFFVDKGLELLNKNANLSFITSDSYIEKEYFADLRKLILKKATYISNVKLGDNVFENVNLPTALLFISVSKYPPVQVHQNYI